MLAFTTKATQWFDNFNLHPTSGNHAWQRDISPNSSMIFQPKTSIHSGFPYVSTSFFHLFLWLSCEFTLKTAISCGNFQVSSAPHGENWTKLVTPPSTGGVSVVLVFDNVQDLHTVPALIASSISMLPLVPRWKTWRFFWGWEMMVFNTDFENFWNHGCVLRFQNGRARIWNQSFLVSPCFWDLEIAVPMFLMLRRRVCRLGHSTWNGLVWCSMFKFHGSKEVSCQNPEQKRKWDMLGDKNGDVNLKTPEIKPLTKKQWQYLCAATTMILRETTVGQQYPDTAAFKTKQLEQCQKPRNWVMMFLGLYYPFVLGIIMIIIFMSWDPPQKTNHCIAIV